MIRDTLKNTKIRNSSGRKYKQQNRYTKLKNKCNNINNTLYIIFFSSFFIDKLLLSFFNLDCFLRFCSDLFHLLL